MTSTPTRREALHPLALAGAVVVGLCAWVALSWIVLLVMPALVWVVAVAAACLDMLP
jgi:hypothetical protein